MVIFTGTKEPVADSGEGHAGPSDCQRTSSVLDGFCTTRSSTRTTRRRLTADPVSLLDGHTGNQPRW